MVQTIGRNDREPYVDLVAVGDISLGDSAQGVGLGVHTMFERRNGVGDYPFDHIGSLFQDADLVFGNLETVLSHAGLTRWKASSLEMRGHPQAAGLLLQAGFTVLNVANNHVMQHGMAAFDETVEVLRSNGLGVVGVASSARDRCAPYVVDVNGFRITILGFAFEQDKYASGPVGYAFGPDMDIRGQVAAARRDSDIVICSMHWGVEFVPYPSLAEETLGRQLIDAGANLILGHHPHVARRTERYKDGLIAYSLGNFVFAMPWSPLLRLGLVLRVRLSSLGVEQWSTEVVWIDDDYQPRPLAADDPSAVRLLESLQETPEWVRDDDRYREEYERCVNRNRLQSYGHFIGNVSRRPLTYTLQTLVGTARRKMVSRG